MQDNKHLCSKLEAFRAAALAGIAAFERGDYKSFATFDELERYLVDIAEAEIAKHR